MKRKKVLLLSLITCLLLITGCSNKVKSVKVKINNGLGMLSKEEIKTLDDNDKASIEKTKQTFYYYFDEKSQKFSKMKIVIKAPKKDYLASDELKTTNDVLTKGEKELKKLLKDSKYPNAVFDINLKENKNKEIIEVIINKDFIKYNMDEQDFSKKEKKAMDKFFNYSSDEVISKIEKQIKKEKKEKYIKVDVEKY